MAEYALTLILNSPVGTDGRNQMYGGKITAASLTDAQMQAQAITHSWETRRPVVEAVLSSPEPPFEKIARWRQHSGWKGD